MGSVFEEQWNDKQREASKLISEQQEDWGGVTLEQLHCNCCLTFIPLRRGSPAQRKEAVSGPIRPIELDKDVPRVGGLQKCLQSTPP